MPDTAVDNMGVKRLVSQGEFMKLPNSRQLVV